LLASQQPDKPPGARQQMPAREHGVIEVGREDDRVGAHRRSLSPVCVQPS
jgi:hypothetical protein